MRNYVIINGVNSLDIQGLAINNLPPITKPMIRTQREEIDGRDGDIITELGYSAYDKQIEIGLYGNFDIDAIIKYFTGEGTITFSNEEDKYYYFKILDQIDYEKLLKFKTATITFHCQPFKYLVEETPIEGESIEISGSGSNITLENTVVAPMEIKLKGNTIQDGTPTPDSPVDIEVVSGDNSINVVGKNLLPNNGTSQTIRGISFTINDDKSITLNGTNDNTGSSTLFFITEADNFSLNAGTYYSIATGVSGVNIGAYDGTNYYTFAGGSGNSITLQNNTTFASVYLQVSKGNSTTFNNKKIYPILSLTQVSESEYEPYQSTSYPISLGVENLFDKILEQGTFDTSGLNANDSTRIRTKNYIKVTPNTQYTISYDNYTSKTPQISISYYSTNDYTTARLSSLSWNSTNPLTFTTPNNCYYIRFLLSFTDNTGINPQVAILNIKMAIGNSTEKVVNNPIELLKIGTYQDKIDKSTGKNLIPFTNQDFTLNNVRYYVENGSLILNGNSTGETSSANVNFKNNLNFTLPSGTYTISHKTGVMACYLYKYDDNTSILTLGTDTTSQTFTLNEETKLYIGFYVYQKSFSNINTLIMIEKGTSKTEYEPYGTGWYVKKEIGKVVLDGSETWVLNESGTGYVRFTTTESDLISSFDNTKKYVMSDKFLSSSQFETVNANADKNRVCVVSNNRLLFKTLDTSLSTAQLWKTWLSTNNVEVRYVLATPTYTLIEDTTLISQLEALKPYSYNPVTNITQTNNDAPFELDVSLSYTNTMNVNNIGNIYAKPILTIEGSGTIGIILNDIEVLSVDLGTDEKITIDVPKLEAYNPDNDVLLNRNVTGDYMKLLINDGDNTIAFSGSVTSATLTNYTRWI